MGSSAHCTLLKKRAEKKANSIQQDVWPLTSEMNMSIYVLLLFHMNPARK